MTNSYKQTLEATQEIKINSKTSIIQLGVKIKQKKYITKNSITEICRYGSV